MQRQGKVLELVICILDTTTKENGEGEWKKTAVTRALQHNHVPEGNVRIGTHKRMTQRQPVSVVCNWCEYVNDSFRDVVVELCDVLLSNPHLGWAESMFSLASMRMMKNALLLLRCLLNEEEDRPLSSVHCHPLVRKRDGPRYKPASQGLDFPRTMDQLTIMQTATAGLGVTTISLWPTAVHGHNCPLGYHHSSSGIGCGWSIHPNLIHGPLV